MSIVEYHQTYDIWYHTFKYLLNIDLTSKDKRKHIYSMNTVKLIYTIFRNNPLVIAACMDAFRNNLFRHLKIPSNMTTKEKIIMSISKIMQKEPEQILSYPCVKSFESFQDSIHLSDIFNEEKFLIKLLSLLYGYMYETEITDYRQSEKCNGKQKLYKALSPYYDSRDGDYHIGGSNPEELKKMLIEKKIWHPKICNIIPLETSYMCCIECDAIVNEKISLYGPVLTYHYDFKITKFVNPQYLEFINLYSGPII